MMRSVGCCLTMLVLWVCVVLPGLAHDGAHSVQRVSSVDWSAQNISRVLSAGYPDSLGLYAFVDRRAPVVQEIDDRQCVTANFLAFDVSDDFAFDVDEPVTLSMTFHQPTTAPVFLSYDRNAVAEPVQRIEMPRGKGDIWQTVELTLDRARFAGRGMAGTDIAITAEGTYVPGRADVGTVFTLCGLHLERSHKTAAKAPAGRLTLKVTEEGKPVPARVGIYDEAGRALLPAEDALHLEYYDEKVRQFKMRWSVSPRPFWPHENRYVFYTAGTYRQALAAGRYTIVVARGPEHRIATTEVVIEPAREQALQIELERYADMRQEGWMSGDVHIHMTRRQKDNQRILAFLAAEDVHLSNILQMNSFGAVHFRQFAFGQDGRFSSGRHEIVPGVEGPRTGQRGHTIALNIQQAYHWPRAYFLYHRFFDAYHLQGGLTGYAHVGSEEFLASRGLALDAPFGYVDFVEIMQNSRTRPELWYELLNLGFRIAPAAGSDFPYFDQPGSVRNYVAVPAGTEASADAWFGGLKAGRTFVTNGPFIDFSVAGTGIGGTVDLAKTATELPVAISLRLNQDLGALRHLELVRCGDVIARLPVEGDGNHSLAIPAGSAGWLAARVRGSNDMQAHTGAIYLAGDGATTACADKVRPTAQRLIDRLDAMVRHTVDPSTELEYWEVDGLEAAYGAQRPALLRQIEQARAFYQKLLD